MTVAADQVRAEADALRERIESLKVEREGLQRGYLPKPECIERTHQMVDSYAGRFEAQGVEYHLSEQLRPCGAPGHSGLFKYEINSVSGFDYRQTLDLGGLLCFCMGDTIKAKLAETIKAMEFDEGPPAAERPELIKALDKQILDLERKEEALIREAEAAGIKLLRHPDANPAVVLELREDTHA